MRKLIMGGLVVASLVGCGGNDGFSVSARVGAPRTGAAGTTRSALSVQAASGIDVTRVRMVVGKLDLEQAGETEGEVEAGPFLIDLSGAALSGSTTELLNVTVQPGEYEKLQIGIHKLEDDQAPGDAAFAALREKEASVIIDGTIDGEPFSFVSALTVEQEREAHFVVGEAGGNVTLNFDASTWFTAEDGSRLDPRSGENKSKIEEAIKRSIDAYDDEDRDGSEDLDD